MTYRRNRKPRYWIFVVIGLIPSGFFGYKYQKEQSNIETLKSQIDTLQKVNQDYSKFIELYNQNKDNLNMLINMENRCLNALDLYLDDSAHAQLYQINGFVSNFSYEKRGEIVSQIKTIRDNYQYPFCSNIIALEVYRQKNKIEAEEIDKFFVISE